MLSRSCTSLPTMTPECNKWRVCMLHGSAAARPWSWHCHCSLYGSSHKIKLTQKQLLRKLHRDA